MNTPFPRYKFNKILVMPIQYIYYLIFEFNCRSKIIEPVDRRIANKKETEKPVSIEVTNDNNMTTIIQKAFDWDAGVCDYLVYVF